MLLSISNIAWGASDDETMVEFLRQRGFDGLEIAPTRVFPAPAYDNDPSEFMGAIEPLAISSMQSILFGKTENIFSGLPEYRELLGYTKKAIDFAAGLSCGNLVFGCPKNRDGYSPAFRDTALSFFRELGEYAQAMGTVLALEPNPTIYGTNFINTTTEAFDFVREADTPGLMVNVDLGTIIHNGEGLDFVGRDIHLINHIHISEPNLVPIERRPLHADLAAMLRQNSYSKYVSIEMKAQDNINIVKDVICYVQDVFL